MTDVNQSLDRCLWEEFPEYKAYFDLYDQSKGDRRCTYSNNTITIDKPKETLGIGDNNPNAKVHNTIITFREGNISKIKYHKYDGYHFMDTLIYPGKRGVCKAYLAINVKHDSYYGSYGRFSREVRTYALIDGIRNGKYEFKINDQVREKGQYIDDKRYGIWHVCCGVMCYAYYIEDEEVTKEAYESYLFDIKQLLINLGLEDNKGMNIISDFIST